LPHTAAFALTLYGLALALRSTAVNSHPRSGLVKYSPAVIQMNGPNQFIHVSNSSVSGSHHA